MTEDDLTPRQKGYIEGYACALQRMLFAVTGDCGIAKSYDPMTIEGNTMHSYAFNMKDGGRHHPLADYADAEEVCAVLLHETLGDLRESGINLYVEATLGGFANREVVVPGDGD